MKQDIEQNNPLESALRSLAAAPPVRTAADAAYEAGRRDAVRLGRQTMWLHRGLTAAALVMAGTLSIQALIHERPGGGTVVERQEQSLPGPGGVDDSAAPMSPHSYLAMRTAVLGEGEIVLGRLPSGGAGGSGGEDVPSIREALLQRGL
jgi:hypothetical protein